jgi:hypothetical protein
MTNALIIFLAYGFYLMVVGVIVVLAWYSEKLDPDNQLPASIWDEILPNRSKSNIYPAVTKPSRLPIPIQIKGVLNGQKAA